MKRGMTLDEFVFALERCGGELGRWPPALRERADGLLGISTTAATALQRAGAFGRCLRANDPAAATALQRAGAFGRCLRANDPAAAIDPERCARIIGRVVAQTREAAGEQGRARVGWRRLVPFTAPVRLPAFRFAATALTAAVLGILAGQSLTQLGGGQTASLAGSASPTQAAGGLAALFRQPNLLIAELQ